MKNQTESQIQAEIIKWFWNDYKEFRGLLYHNFNNPRNAVNGAQLIALGLTKGNPDLTLAITRFGYGALYIELKKPGKRPEDHQVKQMNRLKDAGNLVTWSDSVEEVKILINIYLDDGYLMDNYLREF
tara:strand:- start:8335 stop:8718 length:384 start_codon:yes stop_codon:yes gene_type:complete